MNSGVMTRSELRLMERRKELRQHIVITVLATILFIALLSIFFCLKSVASDGSEKEYYKHYMTVEIKSADMIEELADIYAIPEMTSKEHYIREVLFMNSIDSLETPVSVRYIVIPYYTTIHS